VTIKTEPILSRDYHEGYALKVVVVLSSYASIFCCYCSTMGHNGSCRSCIPSLEKNEVAHKFFHKMFVIDVVLWSAMIATYVQNGLSYEALNLFHHLQVIGLKPNFVTIASILFEQADLVVPQQGKEIHVYIVKNRLEEHSFVGNGLIDMYTKCGIVDATRIVFEGMSQKGIVSWNLMMMGYVQSKKCNEANKLFCQKGVLDALNPDEVTFSILLFTCAHFVALQHGTNIYNYLLRSKFDV